MNPEDSHMIERLKRSQARIVPLGRGRTYAAYKNGDRRKRPLFYMEAAQFERLMQTGCLIAIRDNQFALRNSRSAKPYVQSAHRSRCKPVLDSLSQSRAGRAPFLTAREVRAGKRFAADFARTYSGAISGQCFNRAGNMAISASGQENAVANRVDAQARVNRGLNAVGLEGGHTLKAVLGHEIYLEAYDAQRGWVKGRAKTELKRALAALVTHYASHQC